MKNLKENLVTNFYKCEGLVKKHSPEILAGVGVVGVVASTILACKATMKVNDILTDAKEQIDKVNSVKNNPAYADRYSEEDAKKDLSVVYVQKGVELVKVYLPAFTLGAVSIGCLLSSNNILRKRNAALGAAYATLDKSYKAYRNRVVERFGSEVEKEIRYNIKGEEVEKKDVTTPEPKPKKKTLEEELKGLWGEDYTSNLEKAKSGIVAVKQKNPELVKRILSQEAGLSADIVDILATVAQDNPAFVDSSKTKPSSSDGQDFKGIKNRFSIQGL